MKEFIQWIQQPENIAWVAGLFAVIATATKGLGEFFVYLGKKNPEPDRWDSIGKVLSNISRGIGKIIIWLAPGNGSAQKK